MLTKLRLGTQAFPVYEIRYCTRTRRMCVGELRAEFRKLTKKLTRFSKFEE